MAVICLLIAQAFAGNVLKFSSQPATVSFI